MFGFGHRKSLGSQIPSGGVVVGSGMLWKQGTSYKSWKHRRYEIHDNGNFYYLDITTSPSTVKGSMDINDVIIRDGPPEYTYQCGNMPQSIAVKRVPITMESRVDGRQLEIVFDYVEDVHLFLVAVYTVSMRNNVLEFANSKGYVLPKIGAGLNPLKSTVFGNSGTDVPPQPQTATTTTDNLTPSNAKPTTSPSTKPEESKVNPINPAHSMATERTTDPVNKSNSAISPRSQSTESDHQSPVTKTPFASSGNTTSPGTRAASAKNLAPVPVSVSPAVNASDAPQPTPVLSSKSSDTEQGPEASATDRPHNLTNNDTSPGLIKAPRINSTGSSSSNGLSVSEEILLATRTNLPSTDEGDPFHGRISISEMNIRGSFWKGPSSRLGGWKYRYYMITPGAQLIYFEDPEMMTVKGTMDMTSVELSDGNPDNVNQCTANKSSFRFTSSGTNGASGTDASQKVAINVSVLLPDRNHRTMELVFDNAGDFVTFVFGITRVCTQHNVKTFETAHKMVALAAGAPYVPQTASNNASASSSGASHSFRRGLFSIFASTENADNSTLSPSSSSSSAGPYNELSVLSSDIKVSEGRFLKMGHIIKNWKSRRYVIVLRQVEYASRLPVSVAAQTPSPSAVPPATRRGSREMAPVPRVPLILYFEKDSDVVARGLLALTEVRFSLDDANIAKSMASGSNSLLEDGVTITIWALTDIDLAAKDAIKQFDMNIEGKQLTQSSSSTISDPDLKFKELLLVFPRMDEAIRFVNCVASVSYNSNGKWFLENVLTPGGSTNTATGGVGTDNDNNIDDSYCKVNRSAASLATIVDLSGSTADGTSMLLRQSKPTPSTLIKRGVLLKLKVSGKLLRSWRSRWFEIHSNPENPALGGTFSYQSETFSAGQAMHLKSKSLADHHLIVGLVEIKACIEDPAAFVADPSACSVVAPDVSVFNIALRLHFAAKYEAERKPLGPTADFTTNDVYCLCVPRDYYDGSIPSPPSPAQGGAEWEAKTDAATYISMLEFLQALLLAAPDSNIQEFLKRLKFEGSIRQLYHNRALPAPVEKEPEFEIPQNTIYRLTSCRTCALVFLFRYIAAGHPVSKLWDAFGDYLAVNIEESKYVWQQLGERDGWGKRLVHGLSGDNLATNDSSTKQDAITAHNDSKKTN